jgi:hypothetical protein
MTEEGRQAIAQMFPNMPEEEVEENLSKLYSYCIETHIQMNKKDTSCKWVCFYSPACCNSAFVRPSTVNRGPSPPLLYKNQKFLTGLYDFLGTDFAERFLSEDCIFVRSPSTGHLMKMQEV